MSDLAVARTILEQLGGNRFRMMTGAKNFVGTENGLIFMLPTKRGPNKVVIDLEPTDTYTMTFHRVRGGGGRVTHKFEDVYCDQLQPLFTQATGLYTHL